MALIGFARVSTREQDLQTQLNRLTAAGCKKIFQGKNSGKKESNSARLAELLAYAREEDVVIVTSLDRLGRSLKQILEVLEHFDKNNIGFKTLDGAIDTTNRNSPFSQAMTQILGALAELERKLIVMRTQEGKAAKGEAAKGGRPSRFEKMSEAEQKQFKADIAAGKSISQLAKKYDIHQSTAIRLRKKIKEETKNLL